MAESDPNPIEPPDDRALGPVDDGEIERVLAEAADLSSQLETELGTPGHEPGSMADLASFEETPPPTDVDDQLEQVQAMLADVSGGNADPTPSDAGGAPPGPSSQNPDLPTLADSRDARPSPADAANSAAPDASPSPTADQPMTAPADWGYDPRSESREPTEAAVGTPESEKGSDSGSPARVTHIRGLMGKAPSIIIGLRGPVSRVLRLALHHILRAADAIDRMFSFVSYEGRRILGWVALALFVAAIAITSYSHTPWSL